MTTEVGAAPWRVVGRGVVAGLAGTALMTLAQTTVGSKLPSGPPPRRAPRYPSEPEAKDESAPETTARRLVEGLAARHLPGWWRPAAGQVVHFATGAAWGALFSLFVRRPSWWKGLAFGALVWMAGDELVVPALHLADWAPHYPVGTHARGLLLHVTYGVGTALAFEGARQLANRLG